MKKILLFPALLVSLSSCYYDNEEDLYGTTACETTNLTYAANVEKIMIQSCAVTGCHKVGSGLIPLETYTQVKTYVDNGILFDRVITKKNS